jgi:hypothetical protein
MLPADIFFSCSPNTGMRFDMLSFSYQLFAVRDITEGEELTTQYTYLEYSAATRRKDLRRYFHCTCSSCTDAVASDPRRAAISAFRPSISGWVYERALSDDWLLVKCREILALIALEGLEAILQHFSTTKAMLEIYICLGNASAASEWAGKLDKFGWEETDLDVKPLLDPESPAYPKHPLWRMRFDPI